MTTVRVRRRGDDFDLTAGGHSGDDRVCAAVSMLICALMETLERARPEFDELHVSYGDGRAEISARAGGEAARSRLDHCLDMTLSGCDLLERAFPDRVRLEVA